MQHSTVLKGQQEMLHEREISCMSGTPVDLFSMGYLQNQISFPVCQRRVCARRDFCLFSVTKYIALFVFCERNGFVANCLLRENLWQFGILDLNVVSRSND